MFKQLFHWKKKSKDMSSDPEEKSAITIPPPQDSFPDGVKVWHAPEDAIVDICFVHGLSGDRDKSWRGEGLPKPWPLAFLPSKIPKARLLTYGYDAYTVRRTVASSNGLIDHATNMLHDLTADRTSANATTRPLIFVAHSFGGIVCKAAMIDSRNNPEPHLRSIFDCTKGIAFMGTPHRGCWLADWAKIPARVLGQIKSTNCALLDVVQTDTQYLKYIQHSFLSMVREVRESSRDLQITCFFEELPMSGYSVVSKDSATFEGYSIVSIHANHSDMVKFGSEENNGFKRLLGELLRWAKPPRALTPEPSGSRETEMIPEATVRPPAGETPTDTTTGSMESEPTWKRKPAPSSFHQSGSGHQFNTSGGAQNINTGHGQQFFGGNFHGPVSFGGQM